MEHLKKVFPHVHLFYTNDSSKGISRSEANTKKVENSNELAILEAKFNNFDLYNTSTVVISAQGISEGDKHEVNVLDVDDFKTYDKIAELCGQNAKLGSALNDLKTIYEKVNRLTNEELSKLFSIEKPASRPVLNSSVKSAVINTSISNYCEYDRIEDMMRHCSQELQNKFIEANIDLKSALANESIAALYGRIIHNKGLLRLIQNADESPAPVSENIADFRVTKYRELAYAKEDYVAITKEFEDKHKELQKSKNSILKQCKDIARQLEAEYNAEYLKEYQKHYLDCAANDDLHKMFDAKCAQFKLLLEKEWVDLLIIE